MDTSGSIPLLLWVGLALSIVSEIFRPKLQRGETLSFRFHLNFTQLKHTAWYALIPVIAAIILQGYGTFTQAVCFAIGILAPWIIGTLALQPAVSGLVLLGLVWLVPVIAPGAESYIPHNLALVSGFALYQLIQTFLPHILAQEQYETTLQPVMRDSRAVLAPMLWLIGTSWIETAIPGDANITLLQACTAVVLILSALFRLIPTLKQPVLEDYGKPVALAVACAAGIGIIGDVILHQSHMTEWATVLAGAVMVGHLLAERSDEQSEKLSVSLIDLAILGITVLVASRIFGTLGWIITGLVFTLSHIHRSKTPSAVWQVAALFLTGRSFLQIFLYQFNPNVTGINITHPYASAAMFGGISLLLVTRDMFSKLSLQANMAFWTVLTVGLGFYLHAEATGSFLVSALMGGSALALIPAFNAKPNDATGMDLVCPSVFSLLPLWLISFSWLTSPLLTLGTQADKMLKLQVLLGLFIVSVIIVAVNMTIARRKTASAS